MAGPTPGLRPDPRGDHGHRRRVPGAADARDLRDLGRGAHRRRDRGRRHDAVRRHVRVRPGRHQARARVLHDQPARVHVPRGRAQGVLDRALHARRARVLQGADVPGRRVGDARDARPHGHETDGRPAPEDAGDGRDVHRRRAGAGRRLPAVGVLRQGRDPRGGEQHGTRVVVRPRRGRRADLRAVHRQAGVPHVLRPCTVGGGRARPRVPGHHDRPARAAGDRRGRGEPARSDDPRRPLDVHGARGRAGARGHGRSPVRRRSSRSRPRWSWSACSPRGSSTGPARSTGSRSGCGCSPPSACSNTGGTWTTTTRRCWSRPARPWPRGWRTCSTPGSSTASSTGSERAFRALARSGRRLQTGLVRTYALAFLAGAIGLLVYVGFRL